jgi:hypothetical protein
MDAQQFSGAKHAARGAPGSRRPGSTLNVGWRAPYEREQASPAKNPARHCSLHKMKCRSGAARRSSYGKQAAREAPQRHEEPATRRRKLGMAHEGNDRV